MPRHTNGAQVERGQRRLADDKTTWKLLRMMRECRPRPAYDMNEAIGVFVFDQSYEWIGMQKRGKRSSMERHNAQGMPVAIENLVYINALKVRDPAAATSSSLYSRPW